MYNTVPKRPLPYTIVPTLLGIPNFFVPPYTIFHNSPSYHYRHILLFRSLYTYKISHPTLLALDKYTPRIHKHERLDVQNNLFSASSGRDQTYGSGGGGGTGSPRVERKS